MAAILNRLIVNICCDEPPVCRDFYVQLFAFEVQFESDWYIQLRAEPGLELGLIARNHEIVPPASRSQPSGSYLTLVTDELDSLHKRARDLGHAVLQEPHDTFYGQRRLLLCDPEGMVVDVSAPIA